MNRVLLPWVFTLVGLMCTGALTPGGSRAQPAPHSPAAVRGEAGAVALAQVTPPRVLLRLGLQPDLPLPSLMLAQEWGWLEAEGLAVELRNLGWGEIVDSLVAGGLDVGWISPTAHLLAYRQGHDLQAIAAGAVEAGASPTRGLVVAAGAPIDKAGDLVGRSVAVADVGSPDALVLQAWLDRQGIEPPTVRLVHVAPPQQWSAVAQGHVAAALLAEPYLSAALGRGARWLASPYADQPTDLPLSYFVADLAWLRRNGDRARRFASVIHRVHTRLQTDPVAHRAATARYLGLDAPPPDQLTVPRLETRLTAAQVEGWAAIIQRTAGGAQPTRAVNGAALLFDTVQ